MIQFLFFCGVVLFLSGVTTEMLAEGRHHTIAKRKSAKGKSAKRKVHNKRIVANSLSPFGLRVLYPPSYRFLTKQMRDKIDRAENNDVVAEVVKFFPIAAGIEGEFNFNNRFSLAIMGSFAYQGNLITAEKDGRDINLEEKIGYYEFVVNSSLYFNTDYFKLGPGAGLTFANVTSDKSKNNDGKKIEVSYKTSWKKVSAHLSLRRDFFSAQGMGIGIGLTASIYLTDMFDRSEERKVCNEGRGCETKTRDDLDEDNEGLYSVVLMPMIYLAF